MPCCALPDHTSFINSVACCAVSWTYLSGLRRAMSYVRLAISVPCHAVSYFLSSSPCHAVPFFAFADPCRAMPCPPGADRASADLAHAWRACLGAPCHPVSCEFPCRSVPGLSLVRGGPCHAVSYVEVASSSRVMPCHITCVPGRCRALP